MKKIIAIFSLMIIMFMTLGTTFSTATIAIESKELYAKGKTEKLLRFNGADIGCTIVMYKKDGIEYPAYCLDSNLPGVGEFPSCLVSTEKLISNPKVWRAIVNGYPYKTIEELGCLNEGEAFLATKQAVYSALSNRDPNLYTPIGEAGERTLNALKQIMNAVNNSGEVKPSADLDMVSSTALWEIDNIESQYVSKEFSVKGNAPISSYIATLEGELLEGTILTDLNNKEKKEFTSGEKFKILIPLLNIQNDGSFKINVQGKVKTKPILYGDSGNSTTQDYAITGEMFEDGLGEEVVSYSKNHTKIVITKKKESSEILLPGVEFSLLDENQGIVKEKLITDENGQIVIENILPGTYYLKETKTLEGYNLYNKLIKVELDLNETKSITINNSEKEKEPIKEEKVKETEIEVEPVITTEEVKIEREIPKPMPEPKVEKTPEPTPVKLPKTGM